MKKMFLKVKILTSLRNWSMNLRPSSLELKTEDSVIPDKCVISYILTMMKLNTYEEVELRNTENLNHQFVNLISDQRLIDTVLVELLVLQG